MWTEYIEHSKGPWKEHKYIEKEGDRYYYKETNSLPTSDPVKEKGALSKDDVKEIVKDYNRYKRLRINGPAANNSTEALKNFREDDTYDLFDQSLDPNSYFNQNKEKEELNPYIKSRKEGVLPYAEKKLKETNELLEAYGKDGATKYHDKLRDDKAYYEKMVKDNQPTPITPKDKTSKDKVEVNIKKTEPILPGVTSKISELGTKAKETIDKGKNFLSSIFGETRTITVDFPSSNNSLSEGTKAGKKKLFGK